MAYPTDNFDEETLPDPELNPLLNPVLGAHMGRWAEVYFTTPPERRGQAVSDLLRELKSEAPLEPVLVPPPPLNRSEKAEALRTEPSRTEPPRVDVLPVISPAPGQPRLICSACSADNPEEQRFCGMCGAPLHPAQPEVFQAEPQRIKAWRAETLQVGEAEPPQTNWNAPESSGSGYRSEYAAVSVPRSNGYGRRQDSEQHWRLAEADLPHFAVESQSVNYRYRFYIGIAVGLLLGVLVYMKWQANGNFSGDSSESAPARVMPAAPTAAPSSPPSAPPATNQTTPAPRTVLPTDGAAAAAAGAASAAPPAAGVPAGARQTQTKRPAQAGPTSEQDQAPPARASGGVVPVAERSPASANDTSGDEEFATAEKYLSRNQGASRDNREAAQWLWKAVGKGNLAATMTLSDLYLRGDGVPKSCDQARLLLYAAARKGKTAAAERLRHLPAFGCQ